MWTKIAKEEENKKEGKIYTFWAPVIARNEQGKKISSNSVKETDLMDMSSDFNEAFTKENFKDYMSRSPFEAMESMEMFPEIHNGGVHIQVKTNRELSQEELDGLRDDISGQCSDGWGEGFEQYPTSGGLYISTWSPEKDIKEVN